MLRVDIRKALPDFILEVKFTLNKGILALCGPSGAGKTTLINCIAGLVRPDSGKITLQTESFYNSDMKIDLPTRLRNIGYVFQDYALFPHMTVMQNVLYGVKNTKDIPKAFSTDNVLEMLHIKHLHARYPWQISGGEQQRVAIARALMTNPQLVLMDEPLSAVDDETRHGLQKELKNLQRLWQIPFVIVTHDKIESKFFADEILHIDQGKRKGGFYDYVKLQVI